MNTSPLPSAFATLRKFARTRVAEEHCELCNRVVAPIHRHLIETISRKIICSCDACALRFQDAVGARFKLIPRDAHTLPGFQMSDADWESFSLPINLVFFSYSTPQEKITALYPSPAGATESLVPLSTWQNLVALNPALSRMEPDVEALLVNRINENREYFLAPIDACFELVGLIRAHWRGLSGGENVWREIDRFFVRLKEASRPLENARLETAHA